MGVVVSAVICTPRQPMWCTSELCFRVSDLSFVTTPERAKKVYNKRGKCNSELCRTSEEYVA